MAGDEFKYSKKREHMTLTKDQALRRILDSDRHDPEAWDALVEADQVERAKEDERVRRESLIARTVAAINVDLALARIDKTPDEIRRLFLVRLSQLRMLAPLPEHLEHDSRAREMIGYAAHMGVHVPDEVIAQARPRNLLADDWSVMEV